MSEAIVLKQVMRAVGSLHHVRIFRNQVGLGWVGKVRRSPDGAVAIQNAQPVRMGLVTGSGDLVGWYTRIITPDDIGLTFAQFLSIEVKDEKGTVDPAQRTWFDNVTSAGGIAMVTRDADEARRLLSIR